MKKKLFSLLLIAVMVLSSFSAVFAGTIEINNEKDGHTYGAYQILTGNVDDGKLVNVRWGSATGVTDTDGTTKIDGQTAQEFARTLDGKSQAEIKQMISSKIAEGAEAEKSTSTKVNNVYTISGLDVGYYLVRDDATLGDNDAYTDFIIQLVNDTPVKVSPKSTVPSDDKLVQDETTDPEEGATDGWGKSADHDINESFQFKLTASVPRNKEIKEWAEYKVKFVDTMSKGITFESIASVKINGETYSDYTLAGVAEGDKGAKTWTIETGDIKNLVGASDENNVEIEVIYNAHLNEEAKVNTASGETTNLNKSHIEFTNKPDASGTGKTEDKPVYVFTFEVDNVKVFEGQKANETPVAEFTLYKEDGTTEYPVIWDASIEAYRPVAAGETGEAMSTAKNNKVFNIKGLDAGTYVLKETDKPDGYNAVADITIVIDADHNANSVTLTEDCANMNNNIVNRRGAELPSTGGMGTTIIYILGAALVIGAGVVLVSRKKVDNR